MTRSPSHPVLASYLADAATQWNYMRPRQMDIEEAKKGRTFIYAIDTNVITFWGNPEEFARSRRSDRILLGAGQIFHSDTPELSSAISRGLAGFIFSGGLSKLPLLIVPPTHLEIEAVVLALAGSAQHEQSTIDHTLSQKIKEQEQLLLSEGFSVEQLREIAPRLQELLFHNLGPPSEARRISRVLTDRRAVPLSVIDLPLEIKDVLRPSTAFRGWYAYSQKRQGERDYKAGVGAPESEGWDRRLEKSAGYRDTKLRDHDADVLARLEAWNETLAKLQISSGGQVNWRVLLITFDHRMFRAAVAYKPSWLTHDFAESFLRHPRAFLDEEGVLRVIGKDLEGESGRIADWLRLLLGSVSTTENESAEYVRDRTIIPRQILEAVQRLGDAAETKTEELVSDWADFTRDTVAANPPTEFDLSGLDSVRRHGASALREAVRKLDQQIAEARLESLQYCINAMTELGFELDFRSKRRVRARSVMPIFFERWPRAEAFIKAVGEWGQDEFDSKEYEDGVSRLREDDPTEYAFYLAHAALFAGRGRWRSGALLASRASESIRLIDPTKRSGANGREAAYFEAACRRHSAKSTADLGPCGPLVEQAIKIFEFEQKSEPGLDVAAERFEAEVLALRLDRLLFIRFAVDGGSPAAAVVEDSFSILSREYAKLLEKVDEFIAHPPKGDLGGNRSPKEVRVRLRNRLLLNLVALGLMRESDAEICSHSQFAIQRVEELSNAGQFDMIDRRSRNFSIFHYWTATCGRIRMLAGSARATQLKKTLDDFFRVEMSLIDYTVFPYDKMRFEEMRKTADLPWPAGTRISSR
jgi:hypothetical protein